MDCLTGIHAIKEALEAQRPIDRIAIAKGRQDTRVEEIVQLARMQGVPVARRIHGDARDAHIAACPENPHGNLAAVGDENFFQWFRRGG